MNAPDTRTRALLLAGVCAIVLGMSHGAVAATSFPLYCKGPLHSGALTPSPLGGTSTPFKWSSKGAGAKNPGAGECAWADRGPRGKEIQHGHGNVICDALNSVHSLAAGKYLEICVFRDPNDNNCMSVTQFVGLVKSPFSADPVCPPAPPPPPPPK